MSYKDCSKDLQALVSREIAAHVAKLPSTIEALRQEARAKLARADSLELGMRQLIECDAAQDHNFVPVTGSGMLGDRFQEVCSNCGWTHNS